MKLGDTVDLSIFPREGDIVDITGTSKGKGTAGVIKRYGFSRGPKTHGSKFHRGIGALGRSSLPRQDSQRITECQEEWVAKGNSPEPYSSKSGRKREISCW